MTKGTTTKINRTSVARPKPRLKPRTLRPWRVILHNDDFNDGAFVIAKVLELTPLLELEALQKVVDAHETGQSLLLTTHRERAELYVEQFSSYRITTTAEPG